MLEKECTGWEKIFDALIFCKQNFQICYEVVAVVAPLWCHTLGSNENVSQWLLMFLDLVCFTHLNVNRSRLVWIPHPDPGADPKFGTTWPRKWGCKMAATELANYSCNYHFAQFVGLYGVYVELTRPKTIFSFLLFSFIYCHETQSDTGYSRYTRILYDTGNTRNKSNSNIFINHTLFLLLDHWKEKIFET